MWGKDKEIPVSEHPVCGDRCVVTDVGYRCVGCLTGVRQVDFGATRVRESGGLNNLYLAI
ncbi:MAG: hypothetical protein IPN29_17495 [Saprospiraceae bacterium]|nr:hypothetical protein [Saprospiraceae bacterium]